MALALHQKASPSAANAASISCTLPGTPPVGSLLVAVAHCNANISQPTGWSTAVANVSDGSAVASVFYKIAGASESASLTVTATGASRSRLHLLNFTGNDTNIATVLHGVNTNNSGGNTTSHSVPSIVTTEADVLLIASISTNNNVGSWSGSWTNSYSEESALNGGGAYPASAVASRIVTSTGTYSTGTSWNTSRMAVGIHVAFLADGGIPPTSSKTSYKTGGSFVSTTHKYKTGGTFAERTLKYKTGGAFIEV